MSETDDQTRQELVALKQWESDTGAPASAREGNAFIDGYVAGRSSDPFRIAVEEACIVNFIPFEGEAKEVLSRLIDYEVKIALDPKVSKEAAALVDAGRSAGLEEAAQRIRAYRDSYRHSDSVFADQEIKDSLTVVAAEILKRKEEK